MNRPNTLGGLEGLVVQAAKDRGECAYVFGGDWNTPSGQHQWFLCCRPMGHTEGHKFVGRTADSASEGTK